jgi:hypothetical protein
MTTNPLLHLSIGHQFHEMNGSMNLQYSSAALDESSTNNSLFKNPSSG